MAVRAIELLHHELAKTSIFAVGDLTQPQLIVNAMRAGAREFLTFPLKQASLTDAIVPNHLISYTEVPGGHHSRYGRESNPDASITACRIPARHASVKKLSKNRVRTAKRSVSKANPLLSSRSLRASSPLATLVKKSVPTALTLSESGAIYVSVTGASQTTGAANDIVGQTFVVSFNN